MTLKVDNFSNPVDYLIQEGYLAKPNIAPLFYKAGYELSQTDLNSLQKALDISPQMIKRISEDEQRNLAIVTRIEELVRRHTRIIVFGASVEHSKLLAAVLKSRGVASSSI